VDLDEFKTELERAAIDERLDRKLTALKRQLVIWMAALSALAIIVTLVLVRALWHCGP